MGDPSILQISFLGYLFTKPCKIQSAHSATRKTLLKIKGFSEVKVEKVKEAIAKCLVKFLFSPSLLSCFSISIA